MTRCNTISIDVNGLWKAIQDECYVLLYDVASKVEKGFRAYIVMEGAGRHEWREHAASEFKVLSEKMTDSIMELDVGIDDVIADEAWSSFYAAQIMVALYGNHPPAYGHTTKPGAVTFHDHMESKYESGATTVWWLPEGFNWEDPHPEKMLENVFLTTKEYFKDGVKALLRNINFYDYVHVTAGG